MAALLPTTQSLFFDDTGTAAKSNFHTLGFRIDSDAQIEKDKKNDGLATLQIYSLPEYVTAFYTMVIENLNRQKLTPADWQRTVSISDGGLGPRVRKLSNRETFILIENGRKATAKYFSKKILQ